MGLKNTHANNSNRTAGQERNELVVVRNEAMGARRRGLFIAGTCSTRAELAE